MHGDLKYYSLLYIDKYKLHTNKFLQQRTYEYLKRFYCHIFIPELHTGAHTTHPG